MYVDPYRPVDMISNLPDNVTDNILIHLTIRDAVRTSILSKQWRYKWVNLPQLIFDDTLWNQLGVIESTRSNKFASILFQVFLFHRGLIKKFSLTLPFLKSCSAINHLIFYLSKHGVEEFCFHTGMVYKLPSSLFMCTQLKYLRLYSCEINCPPSFKGFKHLIRLELLCVTIDTEVIGTLVSSCPLLEQLSLAVPNEFNCLVIDAPVLRHFHLSSYSSICFKNSPVLVVVSIGGYFLRNRKQEISWNFIKLFSSLPSLQKLTVDRSFTKYIDAHQLPTGLPSNLNNLKILKIRCLSFDYLEELACSLFLIRSSPNLEKLSIKISGRNKVHDAMDFLKVQNYSDLSLNRLQDVRVKNASGSAPEMAMTKLLLEKSPNLKSMFILCSSRKLDHTSLGALMELKNFWRASPNAQIKIETPNVKVN